MIIDAQQKAIALAAESPPLMVCEAEAHGVPRRVLSRLVKSGELVRVARGAYVTSSQKNAAHLPLVTLAKRHPQTVFCLITALRLHDIHVVDDLALWIAVPPKRHAPKAALTSLEIVHMSDTAASQGVEIREVLSTRIRVTSVAKTVVDCFKFRNRIGVAVAVEALQVSWHRGILNVDELWRHAELCRVANVIRPYIDSVVRHPHPGGPTSA